MTHLTVTKGEGDNIMVEWFVKHPMSKQISKWLKSLSPGYTEYLINSKGKDPHCDACRDFECENQGHGDDACRAFKYGEEW